MAKAAEHTYSEKPVEAEAEAEAGTEPDLSLLNEEIRADSSCARQAYRAMERSQQ